MSLKYKFSLLIVSIIFFILLVVFSVLAYRNLSGLESDLKVRDSLVSQTLSPILLRNLSDYFTYQYENYVTTVKKNLADHPELVYFRVINLRGEMIFETSEITEGKTSGNPPKKIVDPQVQKVIDTQKLYQDLINVNGERQIRIIVPYVDNFDVFRNLVEYHFSLNEIQNAIKETILFFLVFLIFFTIIGVGVAVFFVNIVTKPLVKLTKIAEKITAGDLSQQSDIVSNDEVGSLGKAFNQMVHNLRENIGQFHNEQVKLQASINSLSVGFIMIDKDNNIVTINHTARQALCASANSPLTTVKECTLTHIEDELQGAFDLKNLIARCFQEKKALLVREVPFQNRYLKIFVTPIITIGVIGAVILIDDITEAKVMERSKDEFFSIASHELRTPLTAIRGNTSMIKEFYSDKIKDAELNEMIQDIHESSVRLIEIVNDFLDTSRLEMGKMQFKKEEFDVLQLVQDTVKEYLTTGSQKKLYIRVEDPTSPLHHVNADRNKVKQVVINLIGNAIKFTEQGGVTLKITEVDKFIKILISDTGRGIPPESLKLLFRKFQQAQNNILTRDTTKGTGLGLYISKLIMEGMGGNIKIESSVVGKGTTFSISIPLVAISSPPPPPTPTTIHPTTPIPLTASDTQTNQTPTVKL